MRSSFKAQIFSIAGLATLSFYAVSAGSVAWGQASASTPATQISSESIAAELGTTHDYINKVMQKMADSTNNATMNSEDYKIKSAAFQARIHAALAHFSQVLDTDIAVELDGSIKSYNNIFSSDAYNADQKANLLPALQTRLTQLAARLSRRYSEEVTRLYAVAGPLPAHCDSEYYGRHEPCKEIFGNSERGIVFRNDGSNVRVRFSDVNGNLVHAKPVYSIGDTFQKTVYPVVAQGCYSRSCIDHSAAEVILFLSLVKTSFDRVLSFKIQDKISISLAGPNLDTSILIGLLSRADYPASNDALPLYIQPGQIAAAKAQAQEAQTKIDAQNIELRNLQAQRTTLTAKLIADLVAGGKCDSKVIRQFCSMNSSNPEAAQLGLIGCVSDKEKIAINNSVYTTLKMGNLNKSKDQHREITKHLGCLSPNGVKFEN